MSIPCPLIIGFGNWLWEDLGCGPLFLHDQDYSGVLLALIMRIISIGVNFVHVGKTVAHKGLSKEYVVTSRYDHYEYSEEKLKTLQRWSNHLQQVITGVETKVFKIG